MLVFFFFVRRIDFITRLIGENLQGSIDLSFKLFVVFLDCWKEGVLKFKSFKSTIKMRYTSGIFYRFAPVYTCPVYCGCTGVVHHP